MARIVLASQSPRRQELLRNIGITDYDIRIPEADETYPQGLTAQETVAYISRVKAEAAAKLCTADEIVITADTMVFLDHERLGKPHDEADALRMLTALQGRHHTVCTGVTVRRGEAEANTILDINYLICIRPVHAACADFVGRDDPGAPLAAISPEVAAKRFTLPPGRRGRRPLHWLN